MSRVKRWDPAVSAVSHQTLRGSFAWKQFFHSRTAGSWPARTSPPGVLTGLGSLHGSLSAQATGQPAPLTQPVK